MTLVVAFVGCGRIVRAMVCGLTAAGHDPARLCGTSRTGAGAQALAEEFGIHTAADAAVAVRGADVVVLAVDPDRTPDALAALSGHLDADQLLVSLVPSWRTKAITAALPGVPLVRAVPNAAIAVHAGTTVLCGDRTGDSTRARELFAPLGPVLKADEDQLEAVGALSGAGPALVSYFVQALTTAAITQGLPQPLASSLAAAAVGGTGRLLTVPGTTPEDVVDAVASPGGMTAAALAALDGHQMPQAVVAALDAAIHLSMGRMVKG